MPAERTAQQERDHLQSLGAKKLLILFKLFDAPRHLLCMPRPGLRCADGGMHSESH
jgi:hypothetical protein